MPPSRSVRERVIDALRRRVRAHPADTTHNSVTRQRTARTEGQWTLLTTEHENAPRMVRNQYLCPNVGDARRASVSVRMNGYRFPTGKDSSLPPADSMSLVTASRLFSGFLTRADQDCEV